LGQPDAEVGERGGSIVLWRDNGLTVATRRRYLPRLLAGVDKFGDGLAAL
jgi:hypothetical protein